MLSKSDDGGNVGDEGEGLIGEIFGDYEILEEIARGGMGVVFKARQKSLNRIVALKLVQGGVLAGKKAEKRFRREAEAAARLDHPNVVPIYEVGHESGYSFFSMRYVEGASLANLAKEYSGQPEKTARLLVKIARAVQFAHEKGVLHRDIKPHNILLNATGEPYITDFGLAKLEEDNAHMTGTGDIFGTPAFMAPEQAAGNQHRVDRRTDVYGLGAVLYHLLTGQPPFEGKTSFEVLKGVVEQEPRDPRRLKPDLAEDLAAICVQCLRKEASERYATAGELADDLERWLGNKAVTARSCGRANRTRQLVLGSALAGAFAVAALSLTLPWSPSPDETPPQLSMPNATHPESRQPAIPALTPKQAAALLGGAFEIPTEVEDAATNAIRTGYHQGTGLPFEIRERRTGMHFILIPPGTFTMGATEPNPNEEPNVSRIQRPFYLGKYEVTIDEFRVFAEAKKYSTYQQRRGADMHYPFRRSGIRKDFSWNRLPWAHTPRHPLCLIRHTDVAPFLKWLNADGFGVFDVPTESEWEYAARGGPKSPYTWKSNASDSDERANLQDVTYFAALLKLTGRRPSSRSHSFGKGRDDGHPFTAPVGSYESNPLGLYDIVGNLREMCRLSKGRWGFRGWCFNSGGTGRPLLERQTHDPVESSFLLGCRLAWYPPKSASSNSTQSVISFLLGESGGTNPIAGSLRNPDITKGYSKPIPGLPHPRLPIMIPSPSFRPLASDDVATMRRLADEYAADHPTHYRSVLERYEQVWAETPPGPDRDVLSDLIRSWVAKMDQAAQAARDLREQKMNELADAGDYRSAFLVWADLSPEVRPFKDEWTIFRLIEGRIPAAHRSPLQPGELVRVSRPAESNDENP